MSDRNIMGYFVPDTDPLPEAFADTFAEFDSNEQARFFNRLADAIRLQGWRDKSVFQWRYMEDSLTSAAKDMLKDMHEHTS